MSLLSDQDVDAMRGVLEQSLPDTAVIGSDTFVDDGGGGGTLSFVASGTVDCRIAPILSIGSGEAVTGGRISPDAQWIVTLPAETTIDHGDQLRIGGGTFDVVDMRAPHSYELSRRVEVKERT